MKVFRVLHIPTGKYLPVEPFTFKNKKVAKMAMDNISSLCMKDPETTDRFVSLDIETIVEDLPSAVQPDRITTEELFKDAERCYNLLHTSVLPLYTEQEQKLRGLSSEPYDGDGHWSWMIPVNQFEIVECEDKELDIYYDTTPIPVTKKDVYCLLEILSTAVDKEDQKTSNSISSAQFKELRFNIKDYVTLVQLIENLAGEIE